MATLLPATPPHHPSLNRKLFWRYTLPPLSFFPLAPRWPPCCPPLFCPLSDFSDSLISFFVFFLVGGVVDKCLQISQLQNPSTADQAQPIWLTKPAETCICRTAERATHVYWNPIKGLSVLLALI